MTLSSPRQSFVRRLARRLNTHASSGATAVEFAMIAPIFLLLLFAIFETGIIFMAQSVLQSAVNNAARTVKIGSAASMDATTFRNSICSQISVLMSCSSNLQIDLVSYGSFSSATYSSPLNPDGSFNSAMSRYQPGSGGSIELLRASYAWPVVTPLLTTFLVNMGNNSHLISASVAFRNEPF